MPEINLTHNLIPVHFRQYLQDKRISIVILGMLITLLTTASCIPTSGDVVTVVPTRAISSSDPTEIVDEDSTGTILPPKTVDLPLSWPLSLPSSLQIDEARACDIENGASERYPDNIVAEDLRNLYTIDFESPCDWAILAAAYATRAESDKEALEEGSIAWANAVAQNPAYAFTEVLFFGYFSEVEDAVAAPPFTLSNLTQIDIFYDWTGLGDEVAYNVTIIDSATNPKVTGLVNGESFSAELEVENIQALGNALTGLLPVTKATPMSVCYDNYPDWFIILTYQDGTAVTLTTNGSNVFLFGGPWWVIIDDQLYFQYSTTILTALEEIIDELELPVGQPAAQYCPGFESPILDMLFSDFE